MAANKTLSCPPVFVAASIGNLLNPGGTPSGAVGFTAAPQYIILNHIRVTNKTNAAVALTLYKGATGASAAGTEFAFAGTLIPAYSYYDWFGKQRFDTGDYLTGVAATANAIGIEMEGEIGVAG